MKAIEIARRLAELDQRAEACRAFELALAEDGGADTPASRMEAALYILQFGRGDDYQVSYTVFQELYREGCFREEILPIMDQAFYEPNVKRQRSCYRQNCKLLSKYPYLFRKDFPAFEDLSIRFYPFDDNSYTPFHIAEGRFDEYIKPKEPVIRHNFFRDLEKPVLAEDIFSQYELEYLRDNVRASASIGRENHVYLHYTDWAVFCSWLSVLDLRPVLREEKIVFLIGEEIGQYPIDFKARFGIDYGKFSPRPVGIREIQRLILHTQLSSHNGGDFFNEVFDGHPNLLAVSSMFLTDAERSIQQVRDELARYGSYGEICRARPDLPSVCELYRMGGATDKDILIALYMTEGDNAKVMERGKNSRIVPAVYFQPHFPRIDYELTLDEKNRTQLDSEQYNQLCAYKPFRAFKYIKTFTPMRRPTTSHGGTVRFTRAVQRVQEAEGKPPTVTQDEILNRVLNRSYLIDWQNRLFKDCRLVRFEDGKLNPKATFTALAAFLDLPYTESMTYCSEEGKLNPHAETKGFDPAPVYKTYDEYVNDSERCFLEYFMRDAYEYYGYDFQAYDGGEMNQRRLEELVNGFTTINRHMLESWEYAFAYAERGNAERTEEDKRAAVERGMSAVELLRNVTVETLEDYLLQPGATREALLEEYMDQVNVLRLQLGNTLLRGLKFVNRRGQPLHMMPKLEPDPALLEQPLYH